MAYLGIIFDTSQASTEQVELLIALLDSEGFEGILENESEVTGYIDEVTNASKEISNTLMQYGLTQFVNVKQVQTFADINWNQEWEKNYPPVQVSENCVIRAPFHPAMSDVEHELIIEPKMSFGTGHHETTHLMLNAVLELDVKGKSILDMGCGTGVLAILASKRGAASAIAIDYDAWAYENTIENIERNHVANVQALHGGKEIIPDTKFDIILANINRNILLDQMESYRAHIQPNGILLISGILQEDEPVLAQCASESKFTFSKVRRRKQWSMMIFHQNG